MTNYGNKMYGQGFERTSNLPCQPPTTTGQLSTTMTPEKDHIAPRFELPQQQVHKYGGIVQHGINTMPIREIYKHVEQTVSSPPPKMGANLDSDVLVRFLAL